MGILNNMQQALHDDIADLKQQLAEASTSRDRFADWNHKIENHNANQRKIIGGLRNTLSWVHRNIDRIRDWSGVPGGVILVVDHIQDEIVNEVTHRNTPDVTVPKTCSWTYDTTCEKYDTQCGHAWCFMEDGVKENGVKYCPFCGGLISE